MDNPDTAPVENSFNSPVDKQVNKRRSAVFTRQSISPSDQDFETTNPTEEISQESKKIKLQNEIKSKSFDIEKYIESLKQEDQKWREVYAKRKLRTQDLLKRYKREESSQPLDLTSLSDSERAFLAAKPDYEEFNRNLVQLRAMAVKVAFLNKSAEHFYEELSSKLQSDTDSAVHRIINLAD